MDAETQKLSGYDLAYRIFTEAGDDPVSAYVNLAKDESSWLEFKAGMYSRPEDRKPNESVDESFWHVSKAVLGMLNSSGGVVVIGVQDGTFEAVALSENDPDNIFEKGLEAYVRLAIAQNIPPERTKWNTSKGPYQFSCPIPPGHVQIERVIYHGKDIALVFVKPLEDCLTVKHGNAVEMPVRFQDDRGKVDTLKSYEEMRDWERTRKITDEKYNALYDKFKQQRASRDFSALLDAKIDDYYRGLAQRARAEMAVFTPLDAAENAFESENVDSFYSPEAVEWKESASSWLDDDDEDDEGGKLGEEQGQNEEGDAPENEEERESNYGDEIEGDDASDGQPERRGDLLGILGEVPRAIVAGEPGGGKTTCLTYFALQFQKEMGEQKTLAVFIPMGQWEHGGSLERMILKASGLDLSQLESLIASNRLRLVIDAVNECPDKYRSAAILDIRHFLLANPDTSVVISTRHPEELASLELPVFQVQPMDDGHRQKFLERYLGSPEAAEALLSQLRKMPGGDTISENPMLLRLVVEVYRESPGQKLPAGRAGLYRRSLRTWYRREKGKREESGEALPFSRKEALSLLAELAFKSRVGGFRAVPLEEVQKVWGDSFEEKIAEICQGPIVYVENEFLKFRHETFQEYLTAEYLVKNPDALPELTHDDYAQWGMPLAYLVELCELDGIALPESAWLTAWSLNPWLGVALTDNKRAQELSRPDYPGERPLADGCKALVADKKNDEGVFYLDLLNEMMSKDSSRGYIADIIARNDLWVSSWYSRSDTPLVYIVNVSRPGVERWRQFELLQAFCLPATLKKRGALLPKKSRKYAIRMARRWILLRNSRVVFSRLALQMWRGWISDASIDDAVELVKMRIANAEDIRDNNRNWQNLPKLIDQCDIMTARKVIDIGLLDVEHFVTKIAEWKTSDSPAIIAQLIDNKFAKIEEYTEKLSNWKSNLDLLGLSLLLNSNIISRCEVNGIVQPLIGSMQHGIVKHITDFGAFLHLDALHLDGLLHINDMSWGRVKHPSKIVKIGQELKVVILDIDLNRARVSLGLKQLQPNPWDGAENRYPVGSRQHGKVVNLVPYGAFVELEPGVEGLVHVSEFSWTEKVERASDVLQIGDEVDVVVLSINSEEQKIALGIRQTQHNPWDSVPTRYPVGSRIKGNVRNFTSYGAFIEIEPGIDGMIHVSDMSWTRKINHPTEMLQKGQEIEAVVLEIDQENQRISLGLKQSTANPWSKIASRYQIGQLIKGRISKVASFGAFVELEEGFDGLIHISQVSADHFENVKDVLTVGQEIEARIVRVDPAERRIALSMKAVNMGPEEFNALVEAQKSEQSS